MANSRLQATISHLTTPTEAVEGNTTSEALPEVPLSNNFFYTLDTNVLTQEQREFYDKNGFLVIRKLLPQEDLDKYHKRFVKVCDGEIPPAPGMLIMRDVKIAENKDAKGLKQITKIQDFQNDPGFFEYCKDPRILHYVKAFVGENVKSIHTMLISKPPGFEETGRHPLHQDLSYFPFRPANRIVCAWTALEPVTRANGCLVAIPGTHKGDLKFHDYPEFQVNKYYHGVKDIAKEDIDARVHLEMEPGDTVFFHPILIHGSGGNKTDGYRRAISCHYASSDCQYLDGDLSGTPHALMEGEAKEMARKKYGMETYDYREVWMHKSKLVAGRLGTL